VHRLDTARLTAAHLFGPPASAASRSGAAEAAPPLVLSGMIAAEDPRAGLAIVGPDATTGRLYRVGDTVPGGVRLHAVYVNRVLIERDGRLEILRLPHLAAAPGTGLGQVPQTAEPVLSKQDSIGSLARMQIRTIGATRGIVVYPSGNRASFYRLGLRPADLVISVNGTAFDNPAHGAEMLRALNTESELRVTVLRDGEPQELSVSLAAHGD